MESQVSKHLQEQEKLERRGVINRKQVRDGVPATIQRDKLGDKAAITKWETILHPRTHTGNLRAKIPTSARKQCFKHGERGGKFVSQRPCACSKLLLWRKLIVKYIATCSASCDLELQNHKV